jgi:hypothetical protein
MQCTQFRQIIGAEPALDSAEIAAHRTECRECAEYARQMRELDGLLKRALEIPVAAPSAAPVMPALSPPARQRWYAMAAGLVMTVAVGLGVWLAAPRQVLAADLVAHIEHERDALHATDHRVPDEQLQGVLARAGLSLDPMASDVSFASTCPVRGRRVPHLVVQTAQGPVTVIVLPHEHVDGARDFDEQGYRGVVLPSGPGSVAVIARDAATVREAASRVTAAIRWNR